MKFVSMKQFTPGRPGPITLVVIHTAETGEGHAAAEAVASWGAGPQGPHASWHYVIDDDSEVLSVLEKDTAWHAGPVNPFSIGIEHAGRAAQTPEQWADDFSAKLLDRSATLMADICKRHNIPVVRLTAEDLKAGKRSGICGHVDVTNGLTGGKGHTDPGEWFPYEAYLALVQAKLAQMEEVAGDTDPPPATMLPPPLVVAEDGFVEVTLDGVVWLVEPRPTPFVSLQEAVDYAKVSGCVLPTPALADAIWRAADFRIDPSETIQSHDGIHMNTPALQAKVTDAIERLLAGRTVGVEIALMAGAFKDIVMVGSKPCLYGWHSASQAFFDQRLKARLGFSMPLHQPTTPGAGLVVQPIFGGHALSWVDYSHSARRCRLKA